MKNIKNTTDEGAEPIPMSGGRAHPAAPTEAMSRRSVLAAAASGATATLTLSLLLTAPRPALARTKLAPDYFPPPDSQGGWRTLTDAAATRKQAGMDRTHLEQAWEFTQRCSQNAGLLVVRRGHLVLEKYAGRAQRNVNPDMASTGKAFTSIACGIMLREFKDKIPDGLDQKVFTPAYLPEAFPF